MRMRVVLAATLVCMVSFTSSVKAEILNIGDAAPPLTVSSWVKGEKIDGLEPEKTYVVEFWATWCGPCRASIPHLTELAHQYKEKGVRFIGVAVWENEQQDVAPFVEEMGDKMDYNVALDSVPPDGKRTDGIMAQAWMAAAEENGIPTAFVVQDNKIQWIGHPLRLDDALAKIVARDWNPSELAAQRLVDKAKESKARLVRTKIFTPYRAHDYLGTVAAIDEATKDDPELAGQFATLKFVALCNGGNIDAGLVLGKELLETYNDEAAQLNGLAWDVIEPGLPAPDPRVVQVALAAARRAVELTKNSDPNFLDTLAEALFRSGDASAAVAAEEQTLELLKAKGHDSDDATKEFRDHLDRYRKAIGAAAAEK
jgi:thiol-disulfide isomerase/thioredoxin